MDRDLGTTGDSAAFHRPQVNSALRVSVQSIAWTVVASTASVALGVRTGTAMLVAFGAIGIVDAVGSLALAQNFHHGLGHDALSEHLERFAHLVVLAGLLAVGYASVLGGVLRLTADPAGGGSDAAATVVVGCVAVALAISTWCSEHHKSGQIQGR